MFVNCTPHEVKLNDGRVFTPSGIVPRVSQSYCDTENPDILRTTYGSVENLPDPVPGTYYIVSALVREACKDRGDLVSPASAHPECVRNEKGHIVSVPCFLI